MQYGLYLDHIACTHCIDAAYCYRCLWSVCWAYRWAVNKNSWTKQDVVWGMTNMSPRNHVLDGGPDLPQKRADARDDKTAMWPFCQTLLWILVHSHCGHVSWLLTASLARNDAWQIVHTGIHSSDANQRNVATGQRTMMLRLGRKCKCCSILVDWMSGWQVKLWTPVNTSYLSTWDKLHVDCRSTTQIHVCYLLYIG